MVSPFYDRDMTKRLRLRRLVGGEDLLQPTPRRWVLLGIGLVLATLVGFAAGLAAPVRRSTPDAPTD